jgi:ABC-type xylose transport system substrate-binding protein
MPYESEQEDYIYIDFDNKKVGGVTTAKNIQKHFKKFKEVD